MQAAFNVVSAVSRVEKIYTASPNGTTLQRRRHRSKNSKPSIPPRTRSRASPQQHAQGMYI